MFSITMFSEFSWHSVVVSISDQSCVSAMGSTYFFVHVAFCLPDHSRYRRACVRGCLVGSIGVVRGPGHAARKHEERGADVVQVVIIVQIIDLIIRGSAWGGFFDGGWYGESELVPDDEIEDVER